MEKIQELNKFYELEAGDKIFPFVHKNKITELTRGFHKKKNSKYYGLSYMYDSSVERYKTILMGYYFVPKNYLVVPENIMKTSSIKNYIENKQKEGFIVVPKMPSLKPITFDQDSFEHKILEKQHDKTNNRETKVIQ